MHHGPYAELVERPAGPREQEGDEVGVQRELVRGDPEERERHRADAVTAGREALDVVTGAEALGYDRRGDEDGLDADPGHGLVLHALDLARLPAEEDALDGRRMGVVAR